MAADMTTMMVKMPCLWRGLLSALSKPGSQLVSAELWYDQARNSMYSEVGAWTELFGALSEVEPLIVDGALQFVPRLCTFPQHLQSLLLAFIHHHRWEVPPSSLVCFTGTLTGSTSWDQWSSLIVSMLANHVHCSQSRYQFSRENQGMLSQIGQLMSSRGVESELYVSCDHNGALVTATENQDKPSCGDQLMDVTQEPADDVEAEPNMSSASTQIKPESCENADESLDEVGYGESLTEEIKVQACRLREAWSSGSNPDTPPKELPLFISLPAKQVVEFCNHVDISSLHDDAFQLACQHLVAQIEQMSIGNRSALVQSALLKKLQRLERAASRSLLGALHLMTSVCPAQIVNCVLVPLMSDRDCLGAHQGDVIAKLVKESLSVDYQRQLLRLYCDDSDSILEPVLAVLQILVDLKLNVDGSLLSQLIQKLEVSSAVYVKNVKYGKLVVAVITSYNSQMNNNHVVQLKHVAESHQSFMRKVALSTMKKISS